MRTFIYLPQLPKGSGGLNMLLRLGSFLQRGGFEVSFVVRAPAAWLLYDNVAARLAPAVPLLIWDENGPSLGLEAGDLWLCPEGWPHALLPGLRFGCRVLVWVQNWAYLLSQWPENVPPDALPVHYLAVSAPVAWYVQKVTGKQAHILQAGYDASLFRMPERDERYAPSGEAQGGIRIGWMPRKNKAQARHIQEIVDAGRALKRQAKPDWVEISNKSQAEVAEALRSCHLFLATGFPEGFGLPPVEAMACGCGCVGFSGFGGFEYMRQPPSKTEGENVPGLLPLWLPEDVAAQADDKPGNGLWAADGDILGAALALERALRLLEGAAPVWKSLLAGGLTTAAHYSLARMEERAIALWTKARQGAAFV